ncbi:MAG: sn-glycerol-3-phosphate ABC transporter ATP-binding protein UgpC [Devosia sp.]
MGEIQLGSISKKFGEVSVIPDLSLTIHDGEFVVFVGPSGCGKSTLLRLVAGLEDVTSGTIRIDGESVEGMPPVKRGIAMVFQSYALYPHMTVYQNIAFGLEIAGYPKDEIRQKVEEAARILDLSDYLKRKPAQLSGGQRQRVAIGRAIVRQPKVFLFDEPLSNLDAALRVQMRLEITKLHQTLKATMIFVTHDQTEAMTMADRIVVLNKGRVEQLGTPSELYNAPRSEFVASFIGSPKMNFIDGEEAAKLGGHRVGVRPEHLAVSVDQGLWKGEVELSENLGSDTFVYVRTSHGPMTVRVVGEISFTPGDTIHITPDRDRLHVFDADGWRVEG